MNKDGTLRFAASQKLFDFFKENRIRTAGMKGGQRWREGDIINSTSDNHFHSHTVHLLGHNILNIGSFSYANSMLNPHVKIGRYCSIAGNVQVMGIEHAVSCVTTSEVFFNKNSHFADSFPDYEAHDWMTSPIGFPDNPKIHNDVWIGQNVLLKRGITIGDGAVIGAGAVVVKDVAPYEIVGGVPARRIRMRFDEATVDGLLKLKWWQYGIHQLPDVSWKDPPRFISELHELIENGVAKPFNSDLGLVKDIVAKLIV